MDLPSFSDGFAMVMAVVAGFYVIAAIGAVVRMSVRGVQGIVRAGL